MVVALAVHALMPESVKYLIARRNSDPRVRHTMLRIASDLAANNVVFVDQARKYLGIPVRHLFTEGRALKTILLWIPYFMNMLVLYFVINWLPAVLVLSGHPVSMGIKAITAFSVGGIAGSLAQGRLMNRYRVAPVLPGEFAMYISLVVVLALVPLSDTLIIAATLGAGAAVQGAQAGLNSLAAESIRRRCVRSVWVGRLASAGSAPYSGRRRVALCWLIIGTRSISFWLAWFRVASRGWLLCLRGEQSRRPSANVAAASARCEIRLRYFA
jgi:AAHS family 4-hydroxybenzoate transporter-like MFS transporter